MSRRKVNILAGLTIGLLTFCAVYFSWFEGINLSLQDSIYQRENMVFSDIKIIAIDEKTLERLGQFETWTREPYARLLEVLCASEKKPAVIGFDILMANAKSDEDSLFIEACRRYSNVVMASNLVFKTKMQEEIDLLHVEMVEMPFTTLKEVVSVGFANAVQDSRDNSIRYALLQHEGYESFALAVAEKALGKDVLDRVQTDENRGMLIDYTSGPNSYETLSMIDVLDGKIPEEAFEDSIVLVGMQAAGMGDSYLTPAKKGAQMYGVEIHANIIQGLLEGRSLKNVSPPVNAICCAVVVALCIVLFGKMKIWLSIFSAIVIMAGEYVLCSFLDRQGVVVNMIILPVALLVAVVWNIASKYAVEIIQKQKVIKAFQKYVAPQVVEEIAKNQNYQLKLGGEKRNIAVLFVDIREFTPLCESLQPEQVVEVLNEYLGLVTNVIFEHGGTLDKFIGDAAMAVFNAPIDLEDYVYKAVMAAKDIAAESERLAQVFRERFGKEVSYGIGVNCGDAVVGNIGSEFRMDYTAIGDTVNTAARLESNAKAGQILISREVYEQVRDRIDATPTGELSLKGKSLPVSVYSIEKDCN